MVRQVTEGSHRTDGAGVSEVHERYTRAVMKRDRLDVNVVKGTRVRLVWCYAYPRGGLPGFAHQYVITTDDSREVGFVGNSDQDLENFS